MSAISPSPTHPYDALTPDLILDAVERSGARCDGRLQALNSYENRVYQVGMEDGTDIIAKFYRPQRWRREAIVEEHLFALELAEAELPIVAPLPGEGGDTLSEHAGFLYALYPRQRGRAPELDDEDTLHWMGRFIARIHAIGSLQPFAHRPRIDITTFGEEPAHYLMDAGLVPPDLMPAFATAVEQALAQIRQCFDRAGTPAAIRLHGDCHASNVLWDAEGPHFVDLDDARNGPAVQDLWMLLSGERDAMERQLGAVLRGYREFHDFDMRELHLIEALRTLRLIHYCAWLARRWDDPTFPLNFPWFNTQRYWQDQILALREQLALMQEPPLAPAVND